MGDSLGDSFKFSKKPIKLKKPVIATMFKVVWGSNSPHKYESSLPFYGTKGTLHILSKVLILKYNIVLFNPQSLPQFYLTPHLGHTLGSHRGHDFPSFLMGIYEESYLYHQREKTISTILFQMQDSKRSEGIFRVPR